LVEFHSTRYDEKWAHMAMNPPFHADHVGSLRRPQPLIEAHSSSLQGKLNPQALKELEDKAIDDAIAMQERVGLQAITDGEIRRNNWRDRFFERVDGFSREKIASSFVFTDYSGKQYTGMPIPVVVGKLQWRESLTADDFDYLTARTKRTAKATLPSPSANHFFSGDKSLTQSPYKDRKTFFADVCAIYRREIADLGRRGCTYLQLDEVPIAVLCDPANQARVRERGENSDELIDDYIDAINDAMRDRPAGMTICVHLCRGNQGHGQASGGYDPVAERLLQTTDVDGFFLEYDTDRAGGFAPLRYLPKDKAAVLGLISTKLQELEPPDLIKRRVDEASRYVDLGRLGLSPQCGFASGYTTDRFSLDEQERKLAHLVKIADEIWR
jgi:5-methyltetrahydropteroyltriglutamate--homocysteine methyltransferase